MNIKRSVRLRSFVVLALLASGGTSHAMGGSVWTTEEGALRRARLAVTPTREEEKFPGLSDDLERFDGDRFSIRYPTSERRLAERIADHFPESLDRAESRLRRTLGTRCTILICGSSMTMSESLNRPVPNWAAAVALSQAHLIVCDAEKLKPWPVGQLSATLTHEVCHLLLGSTGEVQTDRGGLPRWFEEGVAQWVADEVFLGAEDQLEASFWVGNLLPFHTIEMEFPVEHHSAQLAYLQSESFVRYLQIRLGTTRLLRLIDSFSGDPKRGLPDVYVVFDEVAGLSFSDTVSEWKVWLRGQFSPFAFFLKRIPLFSGAALLLFLAYLRRKRRDRRLRTAWDECNDEATETELDEGGA